MLGVMKRCSIVGCNNKHMAKGMCKKHWQREYRKTPNNTDSSKPEYAVWRNMKVRCYYPNYNESKDYRGRGISMCEEWRNSFRAFYEYVGDKPSKTHSIDRIDNNGNYEPGNVRWATRGQQATNKQKGNPNGYVGIRKYICKTKGTRWIANIYIDGKYIYLGIFNTKEEAIEARKKANLKYNRKYQ